MANSYDLSGSMVDRMNFDEVQRQYAIAMLQALGEKEALEQDAAAYAEIGWEAFEIDLEAGSVEVDDLTEAKARFMSVFAETVRSWQRDRMVDNFNDANHETGAKVILTAIPEQEYRGNWDNGHWVEVVVLDGDTVAFRACNDSQDTPWFLGTAEDAIDKVFEIREAANESQEMHREMLAQQAIIDAEMSRER